VTVGSIETLANGRLRPVVWHKGRRLPSVVFRPDQRREAEAWILEHEAKKLRRTLRAPKGPTGGGLLSDFWTTYDATPRRRESSTAAKQQSHYRTHIAPAFGHWQLAEISAEALDEWITDVAAPDDDGKRLASSSLDSIVGTMSGILAAAVKAGLITGNPVADMMPLPEGDEDQPKRAATADEQRAIIAAADGQFAVLWRLFLTTGLRWAEAAGLRVGALELGERPFLTVRGVVDRKGVFRPYAKAKRGRDPRRVFLTPELAAALAELTAGRARTRYVFETDDRSPLSYYAVLKQSWIPTLKAAGVSDLGIHELRHTAITSWVKGDPARGIPGLSAPVVMSLAGWSDPRMLRRYFHMDDDMFAAAAAIFGAPAVKSNVVPIRPTAGRPRAKGRPRAS
jgi:integrase